MYTFIKITYFTATIFYTTMNAPLIFRHQIIFMKESWGQLLTTITQILVRLVIVYVKYVTFISVHYMLKSYSRFDIYG